MTADLVRIDAWAPADGAARARDGFRATFGAEPDGTWSAPGRVNLIGEHTDYNDGLCLPIALPHRTYAAVARREDGLVRLASAQTAGGTDEIALDDVRPGGSYGWGGYVAGVAWALREAGHAVGGFDVYIDSCVPFGAGLSSSAALEAAVAVALDDLYGLGLAGSADEPDDAGRALLAQACVRAENEIAGAPTGGMDQAAALRATPGHALLLDCRDGSVTQLPFDLAAHGLELLVVDTRAEHSHAGGEYGVRRASCEDAVARLGIGSLRELTDPEGDVPGALAALADGSEGADERVRRVQHVVTEIVRVEQFVDHLGRDDLEHLGPLMDASHASLQHDYEVSCRELDLTVEVARAAGALGARMTGGGFGGSAIALVAAGTSQAVAERVAEAFAAEGLRAPTFLVATASAPASAS